MTSLIDGSAVAGLRDAPLLYVFYDVAGLAAQRDLLEQGIGLPVIENQFHPPHERHGLVKYDAGGVILSLNLSGRRKFERGVSDALVTVYDVDQERGIAERLRRRGCTTAATGVLTDPLNHHHLFQANPSPAPGDSPWSPSVRELRLTVRDLVSSLAFYGGPCGLRLLEETRDEARFATGTVDLVLRRGDMAADGCPLCYDTCLLVFGTNDVHRTWESLAGRGLDFRSPRVGFSDIGGTARFTDPSGHRYCIYEPSAESLTWGSGAKVVELMADADRELAHVAAPATS